MTKPLRVAVISRHGLTRAGLAHLIGLDPARAQVVTAGDRATGLAPYDVAVYDLASHNPDDIELRQLLAYPSGSVVALARTSRPDLSAKLSALGVARVVSMDVTVEQLLATLEGAAAGHHDTPTPSRAQCRDAVRLSTGLTDREIAVLDLVAAGKSNQQIASELYVSINTVKTYIRTAYRRIGATSRSQAVLWAVRHQLGQHAEPRLPSVG